MSSSFILDILIVRFLSLALLSLLNVCTTYSCTPTLVDSIEYIMCAYKASSASLGIFISSSYALPSDIYSNIINFSFKSLEKPN